jgi:hypothetical protein
MKILGMEDNDISINELRKFVKKSEIDIIKIVNEEKKMLIENSKNVEFFDYSIVTNQVKQINAIQKKYDLCLVTSWTTARIAYLADLKYIISFVGNDIRTPPFIKNSRPDFLETSGNKLNFLERLFYKKVLDGAIACVTGGQELFNYLKKFRDDGIRIDRAIMDTNSFNPQVEPIKISKKKFTFFCPQRIGLEKGTNILWDAIKMCKSDFDVIQVDWIDQNTPETKKSSTLLRENKPEQVQLLEKINRKDLPKYYAFADAILGDMRSGLLNNIEREAALCKKPVICYYDKNKKYILDKKEIESPFKPNSNDPFEVAKVIDETVNYKEYREKLTNREYDFVNDIGDPNKAANEWEEVFQKIIFDSKSMKKNSHWLKIKLRFLLFIMGIGLHKLTK